MWSTVRLGTLCDLVNGKAFKPSDWSATGIRIVRIQNLNDASKLFNFWAGPLDKQVLIDTGDLLLAWSGTPGTSFGAHIWNYGRAILNQHIFRIDLHDGVIDPRWAKLCINHRLNRLIDQAHGGVGLQHVTKQMVEALDIPLPPLPVQKQIAAILEKADVAREKRRKANELTNQFLQSAFLEMFGDPVTNPMGWEKIDAGELFEIKLGKMLDEKQFTGKNLRPYLRNMNVQWDGFDLTDVQEMDFSPDEFERNKLRRGDILVCEGGEVGRCTIWDEQIPDCGYQKALHRLRARKPIIDGRYFVNFMRLAATHGLLIRDTSQVTIAHFTAEKFREFKVLVPPMKEQEGFAALVEKVEGLRGKQGESERNLEQLFLSLTQQAFAGELVH